MEGSIGPSGKLTLKVIRGRRPGKFRRFLAWLSR